MRTSGMRTWLAAIVAALATLAAVVLGAPAASAHSDLESSDPQDGATLVAPPEAITFTFNEDLLTEGNAVTLTEVATGARLALGQVTVSGDTVSVAWPQASPAGDFRAAYRVVSADGHPIDGTISFTVQAAAGQVTESASPSPSPSAATAGGTAASTPPVPTAATDGSEDETSIAWLLGIGLVALVGAGAALWRMRRAR